MIRFFVSEVYNQFVIFGIGKEDVDRVIYIIIKMFFWDREKFEGELFFIEGKVVQDVDRFDVIGVVGIVRVFMFVGVKGYGFYGDD